MAGKNDAKLKKGLPIRITRRRDPRGSKVDKYARYRTRVGRPAGPGVPGNKAGRNKIHKTT